MRFLLFVILVIRAGLSASASEAPDYIMTVNRYVGLPNFSQSRQRFWAKQKGELKRILGDSIPALSQQVSCSDLLTLHQNLPLSEMWSRGYIDSANAQEYLALYARYFHPSQVSFIQIYHPGLASSTRRMDNTKALEDFLLKQIPEVHSTLSLISGQYFDAATKQTHPALLPWQLEPHLARVPLDRTRYKYVFEFGRALKGHGDDLKVMMQRAALIELEEMHSLMDPDFTIEDGWTSIHVLDQALVDAYEKKYPGTRIETSLTRPGEAVFLINLKTLFDELHPEEQFPTLKKLMATGLSVDESMYLINLYRAFERSDQGADGFISQEPISVFDHSDLQPLIFEAFLRHLGKSQSHIDEIHGALIQSMVEPELHRQPYSQDRATSLNHSEQFSQLNAIGITNLSPEDARRDPHYVQKVLAGVITTRLLMLAEFDPAWGLNELFNFAHEKGIQFVVATADKTISEQLTQMGIPVSATRVLRGKSYSMDELVKAIQKNGFAGYEAFAHHLEERRDHSISLENLLKIMQPYVKAHPHIPEFFMDREQIERNLRNISAE